MSGVVMIRWSLACVAVIALGGCASAPSVSTVDAKRDVKEVSFVQIGKQPVKLQIGHVDGKTFWAQQAVIGQPANAASRADQQSAAATTGVSLIGGVVGKAAVEANKEQYTRVIDHIGARRELGIEAGRGVLPRLADAWGQSYDASKVVVVPDAKSISAAVRGDLVLVFALDEVTLTEKLSVSTALLSPLKLGMGSRNVTALFVGGMAAYRRNAGGGLDLVWNARCRSNIIDTPAEDWDAMAADPSKTGPVLDGSMRAFADACSKTAQQTLTASARP
jgi:hypothetical protein